MTHYFLKFAKELWEFDQNISSDFEYKDFAWHIQSRLLVIKCKFIKSIKLNADFLWYHFTKIYILSLMPSWTTKHHLPISQDVGVWNKAMSVHCIFWPASFAKVFWIISKIYRKFLLTSELILSSTAYKNEVFH